MKHITILLLTAILCLMSTPATAQLSATLDGSEVRLSPRAADDVEGIPTTTVDIDVTGIEHFDGFDDPSNVVLTESVGADAVMTGLGWNVTITTFGTSRLNDAIVYIDGSDLDGSGVFVIPGGLDAFPGTGTYDSGGIVDLTDNGIPNIPVLPDGDLYIQFFEGFDDIPDAPDCIYEPGSTYTLALIGPPAEEIPTLSTLGLILLLVALASAGFFLLGPPRRQVA